uniref:Acetyl-CoA hydrolase n=1 Tax=Opuntia streptacantha TaxID=393608 RepID=A0A7C9D451_OPUST
MDVKLVGNETQKLYELTRHLRRIPPTSRNNFDAAQIQGCDQQPNPGIHRRAAVLVCIFEGGDGDLRVILTERSLNLSSHSGEVALPGGKMEEGDADEVATALREAKEEIEWHGGGASDWSSL